jgi:DNA-binding PadR family transcriptional regulator
MPLLGTLNDPQGYGRDILAALSERPGCSMADLWVAVVFPGDRPHEWHPSPGTVAKWAKDLCAAGYATRTRPVEAGTVGDRRKYVCHITDEGRRLLALPPE